MKVSTRTGLWNKLISWLSLKMILELGNVNLGKPFKSSVTKVMPGVLNVLNKQENVTSNTTI